MFLKNKHFLMRSFSTKFFFCFLVWWKFFLVKKKFSIKIFKWAFMNKKLDKIIQTNFQEKIWNKIKDSWKKKLMKIFISVPTKKISKIFTDKFLWKKRDWMKKVSKEILQLNFYKTNKSEKFLYASFYLKQIIDKKVNKLRHNNHSNFLCFSNNIHNKFIKQKKTNPLQWHQNVLVLKIRRFSVNN